MKSQPCKRAPIVRISFDAEAIGHYDNFAGGGGAGTAYREAMRILTGEAVEADAACNHDGPSSVRAPSIQGRRCAVLREPISTTRSAAATAAPSMAGLSSPTFAASPVRDGAVGGGARAGGG